MNQQCKVCGEPAAGFHFGAFTCEGCKSFFGRSYNNLSSISECKNNGECIINKKNRTACKACRLRKCLLVGMSKSGSRYGRRSNWFKIHCLLQEQQQAAANHQKPSSLSPNSINLMRHPSYSTNLFSRPPCSKEELMLLGLDEFGKDPGAAASPSISSPDSHNSDSSIEIGDKRNTILNMNKQVKSVPIQQQQQQQQNHIQTPSPLTLNKDLFLPLPFTSFPLMPPPGFLPPTHFLFSSYHNALYEHNHHLLQQQVQQGLLKMSDSPLASSTNASPAKYKQEHFESDSSSENNRLNHQYLDAVSSRNINPLMIKLPKRSNSSLHEDDKSDIEEDEEDVDMNEESDDVLTPPRSPKSPRRSQIQILTDNPIDLSMKSGSSTKSSDDINHNSYKNITNNKSPQSSNSEDDDSKESTNINGTKDNKKLNHYDYLLKMKNGNNNEKPSRQNHHESEDDENVFKCKNNSDEDDIELTNMPHKNLLLTIPLDLTTKV